MCDTVTGRAILIRVTNCTIDSTGYSGGLTSTENDQRYNPTTGHSDFIISNEDYKIAERTIDCVFLPVLSLLGLPANIINMVVFYRQGLRDKMNLCLFALAFVDFMYLFSAFTTTFYCAMAFDTLLEQIVKWYVRKYILNFVNAFWYSSGILTAIIATERCICVVWPLKSATIFKTKTMAWMICGAVIVLNLLCITYALKDVVWETDATGDVIVRLIKSDLFVSHKHTFQIIRDTILPTIGFITFFVISFVTAVTVRKLKTAMDWRQKTSSNVMDKRQVTLVKMLITVSCVYIACYVPKMSLAIVRFFVDDLSTTGKYRNMFYVTHRGGNIFLMINSSVNVIIYYRQSSRFRKELRNACCLFEKTDQEKRTDVN